MKKFLVIFFIALACLVAGTVQALDYTIESYKGNLAIQKDNTALFTQEITYDFAEEYNGQYVTLGKSGELPKGFDLQLVSVEASKNQVLNPDMTYEIENVEDGYRLKIYNSGQEGDKVTIKATWEIMNLLYLYQDVAVLNWKPITDWDEEIKTVQFTVTGLVTDQSALFAHTGYFSENSQVSKSEQAYQITLSNLEDGKTLELHAYWPRNLLEEGLLSLNQSGLANFREIEKTIQETDQANHFYAGIFFPILFSLILGGGLAYFLWFKARIHPRRLDHPVGRLYEPPGDLAPMVLASHIYSVEVNEVSPEVATVTLSNNKTISFDQLIQATLLDLLDRGNIVLENLEIAPRLRVVNMEGLADFEGAVLQLTLGEAKEAQVDQMFADYTFTKKSYEHKTPSEIRSLGKSMESRLKHILSDIDRGVKAEKMRLSLPAFYRPLSWLEQVSLVILFGLFLIVGMASFATLVWTDFTYIWYVIFIILAILAVIFIIPFSTAVTRDGVLIREGMEDYILWESFKEMIREVSHLDRAEIESIVLWNRILVYATLFGYADKVKHVIKVRDIKLPPQVDAYFTYGVYHGFHTSSQSFASYANAATSASHFSASAGVGGGFSGGGGGGGGGAF